MKVLLGTTNPSKVKRFSDMLSGYDVEFLTLRDLEILDEPEEKGNTPEENAANKARFYGQFFDKVICNDSGLYFDEIPLDDERQPGLKIRSPGGVRLGDDEMIEYYSNLIRSLGGRVSAFYLDGIAVYNFGKVYSYMENSAYVRVSMFDMVDLPSEKRHPGWPLDSISISRKSGKYFVDKGESDLDNEEENVMVGEYRERLVSFLKTSLGIE